MACYLKFLKLALIGGEKLNQSEWIYNVDNRLLELKKNYAMPSQLVFTCSTAAESNSTPTPPQSLFIRGRNSRINYTRQHASKSTRWNTPSLYTNPGSKPYLE